MIATARSRSGLKLAAWSLAALALLGVLLLVLAPASWAWQWFGAGRAPVVLEGISGSVWNGRAERWIVRGVALGSLRWQLAPGALLRGNLSGTLAADGDQVNGKLAFFGIDQRWTLSQIEGRFPALLLAPALDIPGVRLGGTVLLSFPQVQLVDGRLIGADGSARWQPLEVIGTRPLSLPGLRFDVRSRDGVGIDATVADLGGPLSISGELRSDGVDFSADIALRAREPSDDLRQALALVGQPQADGSTRLRIEGQFQPLTESVHAGTR